MKKDGRIYSMKLYNNLNQKKQTWVWIDINNQEKEREVTKNTTKKWRKEGKTLRKFPYKEFNLYTILNFEKQMIKISNMYTDKTNIYVYLQFWIVD